MIIDDNIGEQIIIECCDCFCYDDEECEIFYDEVERRINNRLESIKEDIIDKALEYAEDNDITVHM